MFGPTDATSVMDGQERRRERPKYLLPKLGECIELQPMGKAPYEKASSPGAPLASMSCVCAAVREKQDVNTATGHVAFVSLPMEFRQDETWTLFERTYCHLGTFLNNF